MIGIRIGRAGVLLALLVTALPLSAPAGDPALPAAKAVATPQTNRKEGAGVHSPVSGGQFSLKQCVQQGNLLLAGNNLNGALSAFDQALQLDAGNSAARIGRAIVFARQGRLDEAEQLLRQQLPLTPDPARIYLELGRIYEKRGDHTRALAVFKQGIKAHELGRHWGQ